MLIYVEAPAIVVIPSLFRFLSIHGADTVHCANPRLFFEDANLLSVHFSPQVYLAANDAMFSAYNVSFHAKKKIGFQNLIR